MTFSGVWGRFRAPLKQWRKRVSVYLLFVSFSSSSSSSSFSFSFFFFLFVFIHWLYVLSQLVNKFLFMTLVGSALNKLKEMLDNPSQIPTFLAESLPSQSLFFICYIMLATLTGYALQLLRIAPLIIVAIKRKWLVKTEREEKAAWRPPPVLYDRVVSNSDLGNNFLKLLGN